MKAMTFVQTVFPGLPNPAGPRNIAMVLVRTIPIAKFANVEKPISAEDFRI